MQNREMW